MSGVETVVAPVVAEPTTPIKPSEALRLGRLLRPRQVFGPVFDSEDGACAIGAMHVGGLAYGPWLGTTCPERRPRGWYRRLTDRFTGRAPSLCDAYWDATRVVMHLNDDHYWSDDQIVAWLRGMDL